MISIHPGVFNDLELETKIFTCNSRKEKPSTPPPLTHSEIKIPRINMKMHDVGQWTDTPTCVFFFIYVNKYQSGHAYNRGYLVMLPKFMDRTCASFFSRDGPDCSLQLRPRTARHVCPSRMMDARKDRDPPKEDHFLPAQKKKTGVDVG